MRMDVQALSPRSCAWRPVTRRQAGDGCTRRAPPACGGVRCRCGQRSVGVLAGGLDDRLPAGDLALELGLERCGRRVGVGRRRGAEFGEAGDDVRVLQRDLQRLRQALGRSSAGVPFGA